MPAEVLAEVVAVAGAGGLATLLEMARRTYALTKRNNRLLTGEEGLEEDRGLVGRMDRLEAYAERNEAALRREGALPLHCEPEDTEGDSWRAADAD